MSNARAARIIAQYDEQLAGLEDSVLERVNTALESSYQRLEKKLLQSYQKYADDGVKLLARQRSLLVLDEIKDLLGLINTRQAEQIQEAFENALRASSESGGRLADELTQAIANETLQSFAQVPVGAVRMAAENAMKRLSKHDEQFREQATGWVAQGLVEGWGNRKLAGYLRRELGITKTSAERIARTEIISAQDESTRATYKANGIDLVQRIATQDSRVCPLCKARAGNVYEVDKAPAAIHVQDRCYNMPYREEWLELGLIDTAWLKNHVEEVQAATDEAPNPGLSYFEKQAGMRQPPKPVFKAEEVIGRSPAPTPEPRRDFPKELDNLETVRSLGGSTGAVLVRDPETGNQYVLKRGSSPEHLREEFTADEAYRALGVPVPKAKLYETAGGPVKLAEFIEGRSLAKVLESGDANEIARVKRELQNHFAADALLGNWDVVGLESDNILIASDGTPYRIDNGGSLRYRAQGALKGDRWNPYPAELFTLRNPAINQQTAEAFEGLSHANLVDQMERLARQRQVLLEALPRELKDDIGRRLDEMGRLARISRTLEADKFNDNYQSLFTRHSLNLRAEGIVARLPDRLYLSRESDNSIVYDDEDRRFDSLRGKNSILNDFADYVGREGGDFRQITNWVSAQSGSSWSDESQAIKALIAEARGNWDDYFWLRGQDSARKQLSLRRGYYQNFDDTFIAYHAFNYEILQNVAMPGNNISGNSFRVIRTEGIDILNTYNVKLGTGRLMLRGAAESGSFFTAMEAVAGDQITVQDVPHHRIIANYLHSRDRDGDYTAFMDDRENELLFIPEGIEFEYIGTMGPINNKKADAIADYNPS